MNQDERLTPLPRGLDIQPPRSDYPKPGYPAYYDDASFAGQASLRQYFQVIYKRLPIILLIAFLATIAATIYAFRQPAEYTAASQLLIEPRKPPQTQKDSININFGGDETYYNTQIQLLKNPELMKKAVVSLGLQRDPNALGEERRGIFGSIRAIIAGESAPKPSSDNSLPVIAETRSTDDPAATQLTPDEDIRATQYASRLSRGFTVEQTEGTNIFTLTLTSESPSVSARVINKLAEVFIEDDAKRESLGTQAAYDELTRSIDELKTTIGEQENKLTEYMRSSNLPLADKGSDLAAGRLQTISEQYLTAQDDRRKIEVRYNAALQASQRGEGMNLPDLYENKMIQDAVRLNTERRAKLQDQIRDIEKQIKDTEVEKAELLVRYTEENPKVKEKEERIATLNATKKQTEREVSQTIDRDQKKIEKDAVGGALVALKSQLDAAGRREQQLLGTYEREAAAANIQGQAATTLTTLKRELETNRGLLDTYTQRQKEQELALTAGRPDNIKYPNKAAAPEKPSGPQRGRNILIALLVSLAAGIGLAFLLDYLDDSVRSSDDISRHLGLPTLALIPHDSVNDKRGKLALLPKSGEALPTATTALIALENRHSPMAEAYRHLRTSLLFSSAGKPPQTILITSSQPSEGKTTTAINTAITLAQADTDIVIVDCDLRRPRLHSHFGLDNSNGLTNYLSGEKSTENLIRAIPDLPRLKIITSGPIPPNPAELLGSNEMLNLLQFLRGRFKHVIIDSPPAISFTDSAILSTLVDGVVLVAMANKSSLHLMRQFRQRLSAIGARIYGVVLNGVKIGSSEYGYYYGSGYYHYYQRGNQDDSTPLMEETLEERKEI